MKQRMYERNQTEFVWLFKRISMSQTCTCKFA